MNNKIIKFKKDPMAAIEDLGNLEDKVIYLNEEGIEEIKSYSYIINVNQLPENFKSQIPNMNTENRYALLTTEGIDEDGDTFPETYFAIENVDNGEFQSKILGMYSVRGLYLPPVEGEEIYLKLSRNKVKML